MNGAAEVLIGLGVAAAVMVGQLKGQMLRGRRVIVLPAVVLIIGLAGLAGMHGMAALDVGLIAVSTVVAAGIGVAQGVFTHLEDRQGGL